MENQAEIKDISCHAIVSHDRSHNDLITFRNVHRCRRMAQKSMAIDPIRRHFARFRFDNGERRSTKKERKGKNRNKLKKNSGTWRNHCRVASRSDYLLCYATRMLDSIDASLGPDCNPED